MNNGWVKHFYDGTIELGYDELVAEKKASWSRGRFENIIGVSLYHNGISVAIEGLGRFWQADMMESTLFSTDTTYVKRMISKQIREYDTCLVFRNNTAIFSMFPEKNAISISEENVGKWFTFEIDCNTNSTNWRIEKNGPIPR